MNKCPSLLETFGFLQFPKDIYELYNFKKHDLTLTTHSIDDEDTTLSIKTNSINDNIDKSIHDDKVNDTYSEKDNSEKDNSEKDNSEKDYTDSENTSILSSRQSD